MGAGVPSGADNRKVSEQRADAALHAECKNNPQGLESIRRLAICLLYETFVIQYSETTFLHNEKYFFK